MTTIRAEADDSQWSSALRRLAERLDRATRDGTNDAVNLVERTVRDRLMMQSHLAGTPTPSMPGEPPAMITGALARSIQGEPAVQEAPYVYSAKIGPTAVYSRIQELGGRIQNHHTPMWKRGMPGEGVYLPPRPYFGPTIESLRDEIRRCYTDRWMEVIRHA